MEVVANQIQALQQNGEVSVTRSVDPALCCPSHHMRDKGGPECLLNHQTPASKDDVLTVVIHGDRTIEAEAAVGCHALHVPNGQCELCVVNVSVGGYEV